MMHRLEAQWVLPGSSSRCLIVPWFDKSAGDTHRHVSVFSVLRMLDGWLTSRRLVLREIYAALEGHPPARHEQLKTCLAEAFRTGRLVVLQEAAPEGGEASPSSGLPPVLGGPIRSGPKAGGSVTLELEWSEAVIEQLPADVSLVLSRSGQPPRTYTPGMTIREDGVARLSLGGFSGTEKLTLTARTGRRELVLFRDQLAGDLKWEHSLEELLEPEAAPEQQALVKAGRTPDDAQSEPDTAVVLEV